jgi:hypothetical protein
MIRIQMLAVVTALVIATPVLAQAQEGVNGPGSRRGLEPDPGPRYHHHYNRHYSRAYSYDRGFWPGEMAGDIVGGAIGTAGAIATAPFGGSGAYDAYAMGGSDYCAQRYRSYDPQSGTFMGDDGLRHPCP